jgi:hypothetical protein
MPRRPKVKRPLTIADLPAPSTNRCVRASSDTGLAIFEIGARASTRSRPSRFMIVRPRIALDNLDQVGALRRQPMS